MISKSRKITIVHYHQTFQKKESIGEGERPKVNLLQQSFQTIVHMFQNNSITISDKTVHVLSYRMIEITCKVMILKVTMIFFDKLVIKLNL